MAVAIIAFFDPPTWSYNFLAFLFTVAGIGIAIWALVLAYWQIGEAVTAARAARDAAQQARNEVRQISIIIEISKLSQLSRQLLDLIRDKKFLDAATRAHELRTGIAEIQVTLVGKKLQTADEWRLTAATITQVQDIMELRQSLDHDEDTRRCLSSIASIDEKLHALMAQAANAKDSTHAFS